MFGVAKFFVGRKFSSVSQSVSSASGNNAAEESESGLDERGGVKWYEYNFPPYLNLIHYNPWHGDNIPLACKKTASIVYFAYRTSVFNLTVNLGTNIALLALGYAPARDVILSIFQFIILSVLASVAFYWHYRGIAGEIRREKQLYYALESVLCLLWILFLSLDSNNIHGFSAFGAHSADPPATNGTAPAGTPPAQPLSVGSGQGALYDIFALTEGSLWSLCLLFSLGGLWRVFRYRGHSIHFAREQPVQAKTRHKKGRASALTQAM